VDSAAKERVYNDTLFHLIGGNRSPPLNRLKSICRGITRITRKSGLLKVVFRVFQRDSVAKYAFNFKGYEQIP